MQLIFKAHSYSNTSDDAATLLETYLSDEDTMSLRNLSCFRNYLVGSISDLKRKTISILAQIFPEYHSAFSDIFGKISKELLMQLNSPSDMPCSKMRSL